MATITAKATSGSIYNVLDPNTWIGGIVPGPNDIAVFPAQSIRAFPNQSPSINYIPYTPWTGFQTLTVNTTAGFPASGSFYCFPELMQDVLLPVKIDYQSTSSVTFISCSIDHSYREWRYQNSHSYTEKFPGDNPVAMGDLRYGNIYWYRGYGGATASANPSNWQNCYQLTGSSTWSVARIDMNYACDFTVKDTARLNMFATSSTSGYISILGPFSGVKMLDSMTFNATGSWNTATSSYNGIICSNVNSAYIIISGSLNYSSSLLASSSAVGTSTLTLQSPDSFGVGDFITVQSTSTFKRVANVRSGSDATKLNGILPRFSTPTLYYDHRFGTGSYYGPRDFAVYDSASYETDDVVQIESISGSVATISKRYGKQGDIQQDLGLMDYQTYVQTYVQTYGDTQPNYFPGQKRVVLVDSQHMDYKAGETLIINGNAYPIIETTTYLSQSHYIDFTNPATKWTDYIDLDEYMYSGSGYNMSAGDWNKLYRKYTLLTTASRNGTSSLHISSASLSNPASPSGFEFQTYLHIKRTYFKNGEIEITGSIVRDFTRTGSTDLTNFIGIFAGGSIYQRAAHVGSLWNDPTVGGIYDPALGFIVTNTDAYSRNRVGGGSTTLSNTAARFPLIMSQSISVSSQDGDVVVTPFTGSNQTVRLKLEVNQGVQRHYVQGILIDDFLNPAQQRGTISIALTRYASLFSIRIKNRYQVLVLDTTDGFAYGDRIKQGGLLDTQVAGKTCKFIANEIEDPMGFRNLNWDYFYKKGQTNLNPYIHNMVYNVSGNINTAAAGFIQTAGPRALDFQTSGIGYAGWTSYGKSGTDFFVTYDLGTSVNFDTVGIGHAGVEISVNNMITGSRIDVADNPDNWTTVWAKQNDNRRSTGGNPIRFYTFPSGSVNKRFIRVYSDGGTATTDSNRHGFFGVYSFATASYGAYGTSDTTNQIKLRSAKNFAVGDTVMFWNRDATGTRCDNMISSQTVWPILFDSITNIHNNAITNADVAGGLTTYYTITAISSSVITLDRPPAYDQLFVGTIVMKCNRGKINFIGPARNRNAIYFQSAYGSLSISHLNMFNATATANSTIGINRAITSAPTIRCELEDSFIYSPTRNRNTVAGDIPHIRNTIAKFQNTPGKPEQTIEQSAVGFNMFCLEGLSAWYYPINKVDKLVLNHLVCNNHTIGGAIWDSNIAAHGFTSMYDSSARRCRYYIKNNYFHTIYFDPRVFIATQNANLSAQVSKQLTWGENYFAGHIISGYAGNQFIMNDLFQKCPLIDYRHYSSNLPAENRKGTVGSSVNSNIPYVWDPTAYLYNRFNGSIENIRIRFDREKCLRMQGRFNSCLYIFDENTYYSVWSELPAANAILDLGNFLLCNFYVKQDAEVRIQLNVSARLTIPKKYVVGTSMNSTAHVAQGYDYYGKTFPKIVVIDKQNNTVIANRLVSSSQFQDCSINETFNLKQGDYAISFELGFDESTFSTGLTSTHIFDYMEPTLDILTADVNNIDILNNNWDNYKLLKNIDNNVVTDIYFKDNIGSETVARTSTNLTTTTRFNKVKL